MYRKKVGKNCTANLANLFSAWTFKLHFLLWVFLAPQVLFLCKTEIYVSYLFLIAGTKYPIPQLKGKKGLLRSRSAEVSVHDWLASRQGGIWRRGKNSWQWKKTKATKVKGWNKALSARFIISRLLGLW